MKRNIKIELKMVEMYKSGMTLQQIGDKYKLSRERIRQLIKRHGVTGADSVQFLKAYGCSKNEVEAHEALYPKCATYYLNQKKSACAAKVKWKLTFKQWIGLWGDNWSKRGTGHNLVMCRKDSKRDFELDNVQIIPQSVNISLVQKRRHKAA